MTIRQRYHSLLKFPNHFLFFIHYTLVWENVRSSSNQTKDKFSCTAFIFKDHYDFQLLVTLTYEVEKLFEQLAKSVNLRKSGAPIQKRTVNHLLIVQFICLRIWGMNELTQSVILFCLLGESWVRIVKRSKNSRCV